MTVQFWCKAHRTAGASRAAPANWPAAPAPAPWRRRCRRSISRQTGAPCTASVIRMSEGRGSDASPLRCGRCSRTPHREKVFVGRGRHGRSSPQRASAANARPGFRAGHPAAPVVLEPVPEVLRPPQRARQDAEGHRGPPPEDHRAANAVHYRPHVHRVALHACAEPPWRRRHRRRHGLLPPPPQLGRLGATLTGPRGRRCRGFSACGLTLCSG